LGKGKSGRESSEKNCGNTGEQNIANPAQQQFIQCSSCGSDYDISKCPREQARLQKEAKKRGELLPSSERSSKRGNQQPKEEEETPLDDDSECFMCLPFTNVDLSHIRQKIAVVADSSIEN
jgi:hypothetical protein